MENKQKEIIKVKIGGVEYDTFIDENGVQRFPKNDVVNHLFESGQLDLNKLILDYKQSGEISQRDYLEFNMMLGYSVHGIWELSSFKDLEFENPLWDNEIHNQSEI